MSRSCPVLALIDGRVRPTEITTKTSFVSRPCRRHVRTLGAHGKIRSETCGTRSMIDLFAGEVRHRKFGGLRLVFGLWTTSVRTNTVKQRLCRSPRIFTNPDFVVTLSFHIRILTKSLLIVDVIPMRILLALWLKLLSFNQL